MAELVLGETSGACERGAARSAPWPTGGAKPRSEPRARDVSPSDLAARAAGGSFVPSGPSGLRPLDSGAASGLRGVGLPRCPPARRRCKRER